VARKATATVLADALPDLITPIGFLCVDAYDPSSDWFSPEAFFQAFSTLNPRQAHIFSAGEAHHKDPFLRALEAEEKLILHAETLAQFLTEAAESGWLQLGQTPAEAAFGQSLRVAGKSVAVPDQIFRQVQSTGRLITELAFAPLKPQSRDVRYADFRTFLYQSSYRPEWESYARGFAFRRGFQAEFSRVVKRRLESLSLRSEPVILHGPTGSGKTVAMGQLAFDLQKDGQYPAIFIDRSVRQLRKESIDQFCNWAEDQGAPAVVVVWDGMLELRDYRALDQYLRSRGRRCVLIGSCYQTNVNYEGFKKGVHVSPAMSVDEQHQFLAFLGEVDPDLPSRLSNVARVEPTSFLGNLYRYLPETRMAINTGLGLEVAYAEDLLLQLRIPVEQAQTFGNNLGELLAKIGHTGSQEIFGPAIQVLASEEVSEVRRLIGFVMVPGQFGLSCPFELLMRAVGRSPGIRLLPILERIDVFRITEDAEGNPIVGPRSAFEAALVNRRIMGGAKSEVDYASMLLAQLRSSFVTGLREVNFAVDLLRFLGPNGPKPEYFRPHFVTLADCLGALRTNSGLKNVRLLLQESVLLREAVKADPPPPNSDNLLHRSLDACNEALATVENRPSYRLMKSQLLVEQAATLGALARGEQNAVARYNFVEQAHEQAFRAYGIDPTSHYSLDVIAWTADDILTSNALSDDERLRIIESVTHAFSLADSEEWDVDARVQLEKRRYQLGEKVFRTELTQQAFNKLLELGSAAGVVLSAYRLAEGGAGKKAPTEERLRRASEALEFIDNYLPVVRKDARALFLRFKLWWRKKTGIDFNERERLAVPFNAEDWNECIHTLGALLAFEEFQSNLTLRLIEAVAFFQRGDYPRGFTAFEQLESEQVFARNRIIRRYLFSDPNGAPRKFSGIVTQVRDDKNGYVAVTGFPKGIPFIVRESGRADVRVGDDFNEFRIAFNMRGPIVDFRV
jgi:hypothetical protein